ncbi:hypothetical protein AB0I28_15745 [Phytomonospora sp. NPDC050363]|uniref:hypothetical protein n=1 Tax=Phytomonospora sp. NPDC050363 TaxID=3155642 RepID=UPI0033F19CEC
MLFGALLLALIVVGTASLLRVGRTLLDRLMAAVVVVAGIAVGAGFAFTLWPWGLNPWAVSVIALLFLGGAALITGRRPSLPRKFLGSDLILLGGAVFATLVAAWPTLNSDSAAERLSYSAITGDRMRHFNLFDGVLRIGGYPFLDYDAAAPIVQDDIAKVYPQSAHYLYALVDSFLTGGGIGDAVAEYDRYYSYVIAGFAFLTLATAWAVRWIAGPGLRGWRRDLAMSAGASAVAAGVLTTALWCSFDPQVLATAFLVVAAAFLARGPRSTAEHLLVALSASVVAVSAYPLFALFLAPVGICAAVVYRRRVRRHWVASSVLVAVAAVIVLVPVVMAQTAGLETGEHLLLKGYVVRPSWMSLLALLGLAAAGLCVRNSRRSPVRRVYGIGLAAACVPLIAIGAYQLAEIGELTYYFDKGAQAVFVLLIVAAGVSVRWLRFRVGPAGTKRRVLAAVAAVALGAVLAGAVSIGPVQFDRDAHALGGDTTWARVWAGGEFYRGPHAAALAYLVEKGYLEGPATVAITSPDPGTNANVSLGLSVLRHDLGRMRQQVYATGYAPEDLSALELAIVASPVPLRLVTNDLDVSAHFEAFGRDNPGLEFSVVLDQGAPQ